MQFLSNASLRVYNTFGLDSTATTLLVIDQSAQLFDHLQQCSAPIVPLGSGSNMLFAEHFEGTVVAMRTRGIRIVEEFDDSLLVEAEAGQPWDDFVRTCSARGWHGLENLVAIPGTVGASPVQNIGAYGVEVCELIHEVKYLDIPSLEIHTISASQCQFAYRDSIFKHELKGRSIVLSVVFRLSCSFAPNLSYHALAQQVVDISTPLTPILLMDIIERLRWSKLPHPEDLGNAGSFFKNPVVAESQATELKQRYADIPLFDAIGGKKVSAAWLIDQCGWRGRRVGECGVYDRQPLVIVNYGNATYADIKNLATEIISNVKQKFNITLSPEVQFNE